jgi:TonB family protein
MRFAFLVVICSGFASMVHAQSPTPGPPQLPDNPSEVFALAKPLYDFSAPNLKPWHFKASYQLYDEKGDAAEEGTFEYWWVSPQVYRSSWVRPDATHTDWHTADGRHAYLATGQGFDFFENKLQSALLSPLPDDKELDPAHIHLDRQSISPGGIKLTCIMLLPKTLFHGQAQVVPFGLFPTYCFDSRLPTLRVSYSLGSLTMEFNSIVQIQNHYLAKKLQFSEGERKILTATVDIVTGLNPDDPALTPPSDATILKHDRVALSEGIASGFLIKKKMPIYPQDAKAAHVSGTVMLQAVIGRDGLIHDLHVISAPSPSLASSALRSVSQWRYRPYQFNGEPVEVETTINVVFSLSR